MVSIKNSILQFWTQTTTIRTLAPYPTLQNAGRRFGMIHPHQSILFESHFEPPEPQTRRVITCDIHSALWVDEWVWTTGITMALWNLDFLPLRVLTFTCISAMLYRGDMNRLARYPNDSTLSYRLKCTVLKHYGCRHAPKFVWSARFPSGEWSILAHLLSPFPS